MYWVKYQSSEFSIGDGKHIIKCRLFHTWMKANDFLWSLPSPMILGWSIPGVETVPYWAGD